MENQGQEFFKLDDDDKMVLFRLMAHDPDAIAAWINETARQYEMRSIHIDAEKLLAEVELEL